MMSTASVGVKTLENTADLHSFLVKFFDEKSFSVFQNERQHSDIQKGVPPIEQLAKSDSGRCFNAEIEIRWRKTQNGSTEITVLAEQTGPAFDGCFKLGNNWNITNLNLALVGQSAKEGGAIWRDTRYPRDFQHPSAARGRVFVKGKEYIDSDTGKAVFLRWAGVEG